VGQGTVLHPNVVLYFGTIIGHSCLIHAGSVIGADGFGFSVSGEEICKIPQTGIVRIGNHVEFGALCTVDRAANQETVVHDFCKFDDHVHIAHNCEIGQNTMFSAQVGIAGSTSIGEWTLIGGQSGVADHLKLPPRVRVGSKSGVITQLKEPGTYAGFPAIPVNEWKRNLVYVRRIKSMDETIKALEKRLAKLEAKS
ncbi:MAG: UDP-3-O-(3-hydroxymyristoyl)glucosamine N-acyltransferase, partial [Proteobacteria bacterium]